MGNGEGQCTAPNNSDTDSCPPVLSPHLWPGAQNTIAPTQARLLDGGYAEQPAAVSAGCPRLTAAPHTPQPHSPWLLPGLQGVKPPEPPPPAVLNTRSYLRWNPCSALAPSPPFSTLSLVGFLLRPFLSRSHVPGPYLRLCFRKAEAWVPRPQHTSAMIFSSSRFSFSSSRDFSSSLLLVDDPVFMVS